MKKLLLILSMISMQAYSMSIAKDPAVTIIEYNESYKNDLMEIAFQDPLQFFPGFAFIQKTQPGQAEMMLDEYKKEMENALQEPLKYKKILIDFNSGDLIGFVIYFKAKEQSIEAMKNQFESMNIPFDENMIAQMHPHMKKTISECAEFVMLEGLAISRDFRRKGYGRLLLGEAVSAIKGTWAHISRIDLNVSKDNATAIALYESEGFNKSLVQTTPFMEVLQYTKAL